MGPGCGCRQGLVAHVRRHRHVRRQEELWVVAAGCGGWQDHDGALGGQLPVVGVFSDSLNHRHPRHPQRGKHAVGGPANARAREHCGRTTKGSLSLGDPPLCHPLAPSAWLGYTVGESLINSSTPARREPRICRLHPKLRRARRHLLRRRNGTFGRHPVGKKANVRIDGNVHHVEH